MDMNHEVRSKNSSLLTLVRSQSEEFTDLMKEVRAQQIHERAQQIHEWAQQAVETVLQILEKYDMVPKNGLIIYTETVYTDDVAIEFEHLKPIYAPILEKDDMEALTKWCLEPDNVITQDVGWVQNIIAQALGWIRNVITQALLWVQIFVLPLEVLVDNSFVLLLVDLVVVLAAYNVQDHGWVQKALGWVWKVITQALLWVSFVHPLVVLVVESFVLLLEDLAVVLVAYNVQDHGWVQNVITQAFRWVQIVITQALLWVLTFVLLLMVFVTECLVQMDIVVVLVVLAAYNV